MSKGALLVEVVGSLNSFVQKMGGYIIIKCGWYRITSLVPIIISKVDKKSYKWKKKRLITTCSKPAAIFHRCGRKKAVPVKCENFVLHSPTDFTAICPAVCRKRKKSLPNSRYLLIYVTLKSWLPTERIQVIAHLISWFCFFHFYSMKSSYRCSKGGAEVAYVLLISTPPSKFIE